MKKAFIKKVRQGFLLGALLATSVQANAQSVTQTFIYTGSTQTFTIPALCAGSITITAFGASGGATSGPAGALGGTARGVITATPGAVLFINVGAAGSGTTGGFNGGGNGGVSSSSQGGGGGGGSDVRLGTNTITARILAAGGGGGGGGATTYAPSAGAGGGGSAFTGNNGFGGAGAGGCATGSAGGDTGGGSTSYGSGGGGGGFTSGGQGGGQGSSTGGYGCTGGLGLGGDGGGTSYICGGATGGVNGGGGGGGGWYGGGGGMTGTGGCNGGGGGGSSYVNPSYFSSSSFTAGNWSGNGQVIITYTSNGNGVSVAQTHTSLCNGTTATLTASGVNSYTWANNGSQTGVISVNPSSNTIYTVSGTNSNGCISTRTIGIIANTSVPTISVTGTQSVCLGRTATLTATGALTYTWSNGITNGVAFTPTTTTTYTVIAGNDCGTSTSTRSILVAPLPVGVAAVNTIVCSGKPTTITAVSSATGYTWTPSGINVGTLITSPTVNTVYSVAVSDGTCSGNNTIAISVNPNPTITAATTSTRICIGESATLSANGGINYTWTPTGANSSVTVITPTTSQSYNVIADNSFGCTSGSGVVVLVDQLPVISTIANPPTICSGGSSTLTASGNSSSYNWSAGSTSNNQVISATATAIYTVIGTLNTCTASATASVAVFIPTAAISGPTAVCQGKTFTLNASGATNLTWLGQGPFANLTTSISAPTTFSLEAGDISPDNLASCTATLLFNVAVNPNPTVVTVATPSAICKTVEVTTITATGANSYVWSAGNATTSSITYTSSTTGVVVQTVTGTSSDGCVGTSTVSVKINACTGIAETAGASFEVYPNPSNGAITIQSEQPTVVTIYNGLGQVIQSASLNSENNYTLAVQGLAQGLYYVNSSDHQLTKKIIVKE